MVCFYQSVKQNFNLKVVICVCVTATFILSTILFQTTKFVENSFEMTMNPIHLIQEERPFKEIHHSQRHKSHRDKFASTCQEYVFPDRRLEPETWQPVGPNNSILVFSAYLHDRYPGRVQIIGLSEMNVSNHFCQFWYHNNSLPSKHEIMVARARIVKYLSSSKKFSDCAIKCSLPTSNIPFAVSLVSGYRCAQADNIVFITHIPKVKTYSQKFTVCLSPLNSQYDRGRRIVEWMELNMILGAEYFLVYNYSSAPTVVSILDYYQTKGIVDIIQWQLPIEVGETRHERGDIEVHYYAQTACLNDCLLRSRGTSEFIVAIDLDEFIIPHGDNTTTWKDIIEHVPNAGSYMFRSSLFPLQWENVKFDFPEKELAEKYNIASLLKVDRETKIWIPGARSKYIARTSATDVALTHVTLPRGKIRVVDPRQGLLHHYRYWPENEVHDSYITDITVIDKYSKQLVEKISSTLVELKILELLVT